MQKNLPSDLKIVQACTQFTMGRNPLKLKKQSYIHRPLLSLKVRQFLLYREKTYA